MVQKLMFLLILFVGMQNISNANIALTIGQKAPAFVAQSTKGEINFPKDYAGKWVVLFSFPNIDAPICSMEVVKFATQLQSFKNMNCSILGISTHSNNAYSKWIDGLKIQHPDVDFNYPIIADVKKKVADKYNLIHTYANSTKMIRAIYLIDPTGVIRVVMYYPMTNGRSIYEIKRILSALILSDKIPDAVTPPDWQEGEEIHSCAPCCGS
jgi:peroxiredoxin 2/4